MNWKDPVIAARLAELWSAGHSCSTIARMIGGVTRNAVIGAVSRADLPRRSIKTGSPYSRTSRKKTHQWNEKPQKKSPGKGKPFVFATSPNMARSPDLVPAPLPMPAADDKATVSFDELEPHHCRWICKDDPTGHPQHEPLYCGAKKVLGTSYCLNHLRRALAVPASRPRPPAVSATTVQTELEAA